MIVLKSAFVLVPTSIPASVPLIVDEHRVRTAFSLMTTIQNPGPVTFPVANGALRDAMHGHSASRTMFAALGFGGLIFSILLLRADRREGNPLECAK